MLDFTLYLCFLLILSLTLYGLIAPKSKISSPTVYVNIPTTIGILGTFVGIALGLHRFDVNDIESSVPILLDGLKTAFWTSIGGMLSTLILKFRFRKGNRSIYIDERPDEMISLLRLISQGLNSDKEHSLKHQLQSLRHENANNFGCPVLKKVYRFKN